MAHAWLDPAIARAVQRLHGIAAEVEDFPHITEAGQWRTTFDGVWTGGFWAGLLWLGSRVSGSESLRAKALGYTDRLLPRVFDEHNHDLGFMFYPSAISAWEATGNPRYRQAALDAARSLAAQFNARAGFIPGWGFFGGAEWSGSVLVDTLMNLPLMVWAFKQGAEPSLMQVVNRHAATSLAYHCRADGSVYHVYRFDPENGLPLGGSTYQGLSAESSWSRGQAWAITGLALLASMTGERNYFQASSRVAECFLARLPEDAIPPWDFSAIGPDAPKDASASAIASFGLLKLHELSRDPGHLNAATALLQALASECSNASSRGGLLLHATADLPHGLGIDESTMYGDYYYLKSLLRLKARMS